LPADLRFSAFNQNTTPVVPGSVKLVGADKLIAPNNTEYYLAQIEITGEGLRLLQQHRIQAGMPVEVVVKTGERSFMTYLLKPLADRFARSFKED
jgi:protease secretion system membrane fusion protein